MLQRIIEALAFRFGFVPVARVEDARETLRDLSRYADRSGHLSNRYKAGKRVKRHVSQALANLHNATAALPSPDVT